MAAYIPNSIKNVILSNQVHERAFLIVQNCIIILIYCNREITLQRLRGKMIRSKEEKKNEAGFISERIFEVPLFSVMYAHNIKSSTLAI